MFADGTDVGPIVEERKRKEHVGMWPKGAPLQVKEATKGIDRDLSVHIHGADVDPFVEETERLPGIRPNAIRPR